jgi:RNA polymerase sigma factor (sigma-70 family)
MVDTGDRTSSHLFHAPLLSADEERAYLDLLATTSCHEERNAARQQLIESNLRLVWYVVRCFCQRRGISLTHEMVSDLFQSGVIGLIRAIDKFDGTRYRNRLSTYAVPWIVQAVSREWAQHHRTVVHLPIAIAERHGSLPVREYSLDAPLSQTHDERLRTFGEIIPDERKTDPDVTIMIAAMLDRLPPSDALVIRLYFGIGLPPMDIPSIAEYLQVSQRAVMQRIETGTERLARCFDGWEEEPDERVDATTVAGACDPSSVV